MATIIKFLFYNNIVHMPNLKNLSDNLYNVKFNGRGFTTIKACITKIHIFPTHKILKFSTIKF